MFTIFRIFPVISLENTNNIIIFVPKSKNMKADELLHIIRMGETSTVQFKERIDDAYKLGCELTAFSNSLGGQLLIGVNDKTGELNGLSFEELQKLTTLVSNTASENVKPSILVQTETIDVDGQVILIVTVPEGKNKPYRDNKGIIWVKNGSDKRKVFDNSELADMMTSHIVYRPDAQEIENTSVDDLDAATLKAFLLRRFETACKTQGISADKANLMSINELVGYIGSGLDVECLLKNIGLVLPNGNLTLAALLLFGKSPQRYFPALTIKCVNFWGNEISGTEFRDKVNHVDMEGNMKHQYDMVMTFLNRNLKRIQVSSEFNSLGELEIPIESLSEIVVNSLVHRSLTWQAPIRVLIFDNRVEIHSPGELTHGLTVDDIKRGISFPRNSLLFDNAIYLLPYTGIGSGILRAIRYDGDVEFYNEPKIHEFVVIFRRSNHHDDEVTIKSNHHDDEVTIKSNHHDDEVTIKSSVLLSQRQKKIVDFCSIPRTAQEIMDFIGISNQSKNRKKYIANLVGAGILEMTIPNFPKDKKQKYRKV